MDDLQGLKDQIDAVLDPAGLPGSVLVTDHNALLSAILESSGKLTGLPFSAIETGDTPTGYLSWNSNAMDTLTAFNVTVSKLTVNDNDVDTVLSLAVIGDIIHFKDFDGRSAFLEYQSHAADVDGSANDVYVISVKGFAENPSFTYGASDTVLCTIELISASSSYIFTQAKPIIMKLPSNINASLLEAGDFVQIFLTDTRLIKGIWNAGSADLLDDSNYNILEEWDLTP